MAFLLNNLRTRQSVLISVVFRSYQTAFRCPRSFATSRQCQLVNSRGVSTQSHPYTPNNTSTNTYTNPNNDDSTSYSYSNQAKMTDLVTSTVNPFPTPAYSASMQSLNITDPKLHLYTASTPNGYKVSILLEELILAYPELAKMQLSYDFYFLSFDNKDQKTERFLKINPNGRIPALVDDNVQVEGGGGHNVFETISIMIWLVEQYDKDYHFWFKDPILRSKAFSWLAWGQGGLGPMQGQSNHFTRYAPEKIPYGIKRYQNETKRLYSVLNDGLKLGKGEWIVGDQYSIVDMSFFGWVRAHAWAGIPDLSEFPLVEAWRDRIYARQGADNGLAVPRRPRVNKTDEEAEKEAKEAAKWVLEGNTAR